MTLESRVKVINFAGVVLQMPHPTRPVDIISEVGRCLFAGRVFGQVH